MPKILLGVSSSFCANFLKGQVEFLVSEGFEVIIISGEGEEISMLAKKENATLITIPFTQSIYLIKDFRQLVQIIRILKKEKPDIVNAGNPKSGFLIMLACWITHFKNRIFTLHGLLSDTKTGFKRWVISLTEKISCNIAQTVIVVSPSLKQHAEKRNILAAGKGVVIEKGSYNGIDTKIFSRTEFLLTQSNELKEKIGLQPDAVVLGFVGRLSKDKGIDILFEAFNTLLKKYPFIRLILAGPLSKENKFSELSAHQLYYDERVFYLGKMINVTPVYGIIDILVLPSLREGFGNVLIEAAAMEIPVIASEIPGCKDAVKNKVNGYLFEKGNVAELCNYLEQLIIDRNLRNELGKNGKQFVKENFNNCKIWKGQLQLYNRMLKENIKV
jgi:glycosyltransferase involved in cell wall biosynthesis